ncbi:MAG: uridine kinase [bacterium]|jgi:uridine kinase
MTAATEMSDAVRQPLVVGIAGGSGSGKTTVVAEIVRAIGADRVTVLHQDSYYRDNSHLPPEERARLNYDHPDAFDTPLLVRHLEALRRGEAVECPVYDFTTHSRRPETEHKPARAVIVVEGILILYEPELRRLMDIRIFVDADADVRLIRRLQRDVAERGRTVESVIRQYVATVRPMHLEFVQPSMRYADVIIPEGGYNRVAVEMVVARIKAAVG